MRRVIFPLLVIVSSSMAFSSIAATCEESYFSPDDLNLEHPLPKPHPQFVESLKQANAGNVNEQRKIAGSYESGWMVSACPEKALYWYQKAASNGDVEAKNWIVRHDRLKASLEGKADEVQLLDAHANPASRPQSTTPKPKDAASK